MSAKIVLSESKKEEIIEYIKNTYQCTLNDASSHFGIRRDVIQREIGKENLNLIIFHGVKDSTKQKLRDANLGKTASEETRRKISDSEKIAQKKISEEKREEMCRKSKQTKIEKFGSWENYVKYQDSKTKQTKLERHGDENYNNKEKADKTKIERYGDVNYNNFEQIKKTQEELYGGYAFCQQDKVKATMMERYGVEHNWASKDPKMNGRKTCYEKYGGKEEYYNHTLSKGRQTRLELYGDEFYSNSEKAQETMLQKYGIRFYCASEDCQRAGHTAQVCQKRNDTKRKNGTFNTSTEQENLYKILIQEYGEEDICSEYQDDRYINENTGYKYKCDFYVKSLDLFIELNYHPTHGKHPFDENNKDDIETLEKLKNNPTKWNTFVIQNWSVRDVEKRKIASKNKLKYLCLYPQDDYTNIKKIIDSQYAEKIS